MVALVWSWQPLGQGGCPSAILYIQTILSFHAGHTSGLSKHGLLDLYTAIRTALAMRKSLSEKGLSADSVHSGGGYDESVMDE